MSRSSAERRSTSRSTRCAGASLAALALVVGVIGLSAGTAAARPFAAPRPFWSAPVKGTVAATPAPTTGSFTLDIPGCSTPQVIATPSSTIYSYQPATGSAPTGVQPGEKVIVTLQPNTSALTARSVTILLASISGTVDTVSPLVVTDQQGFLRTIDVSGATTELPAGSTLASGDWVNAFGTVDPDHVSLDALVIQVRPATDATPPFTPNHGVLTGVVAASPAPGTGGFTLDEPNGTSQAVVANSSTKYSEPGATSPPSAVVAGEHVAVVLVRGASVPTAAFVFVVLDQLDGTVVSTGSSSFVISDHQGFWRTIDVAGAQYSPTGTSLGTLADGEHVVAFGNVDPDGTDLDALFVHVLPTPAVNAWYLQAWASAPSTCPVVPQSFTWPAGGGPFSPSNSGQPGDTTAAHGGPSGWNGSGKQNSAPSGGSFDGHGGGPGTSPDARTGPGGYGGGGSPGGGASGGYGGGSAGSGWGSQGSGGSQGGASGRGGPNGGQGSGGGYGGGGGRG